MPHLPLRIWCRPPQDWHWWCGNIRRSSRTIRLLCFVTQCKSTSDKLAQAGSASKVARSGGVSPPYHTLLSSSPAPALCMPAIICFDDGHAAKLADSPSGHLVRRVPAPTAHPALLELNCLLLPPSATDCASKQPSMQVPCIRTVSKHSKLNGASKERLLSWLLIFVCCGGEDVRATTCFLPACTTLPLQPPAIHVLPAQTTAPACCLLTARSRSQKAPRDVGNQIH